MKTKNSYNQLLYRPRAHLSGTSTKNIFKRFVKSARKFAKGITKTSSKV